jgi:hypothetical protein
VKNSLDEKFMAISAPTIPRKPYLNSSLPH